MQEPARFPASSTRRSPDCSPPISWASRQRSTASGRCATRSPHLHPTRRRRVHRHRDPSREHYLLLNHRLARRIVKAHTDWLDEVERELE
jgi:hypothetical protein